MWRLAISLSCIKFNICTGVASSQGQIQDFAKGGAKWDAPSTHSFLLLHHPSGQTTLWQPPGTLSLQSRQESPTVPPCSDPSPCKNPMRIPTSSLPLPCSSTCCCCFPCCSRERRCSRAIPAHSRTGQGGGIHPFPATATSATSWA